MIICSCKGVTKAEISKAIKNGAQTIVDIQNITRASTGCGRCKTIITNILNKEVPERIAKSSQLRLDFD